MISGFYFTIFLAALPILFGIMAAYFLVIGLRGILTKRPFLVSNKWSLSIMSVVLVLTMLPLLYFSPTSSIMEWLYPLLMTFIFVAMWFSLKGYAAYAVTGASFREALLASLKKLQLSYEESLSTIQLTSVEADLQVSVQSWIGIGTIKIKQRSQRNLLRKIVTVMNEHFRMSSTSSELTSCIFFLVMGVIMVVSGIGMMFLFEILP